MLDIKLEDLLDIRDIKMEENLSRSERIEYLKRISKDGMFRYNNIVIKLDFKTVYPEDYLEGINE